MSEVAKCEFCELLHTLNEFNANGQTFRLCDQCVKDCSSDICVNCDEPHAKLRRLHTAYAYEYNNWAVVCDPCFEAHNENMDQAWKEYNDIVADGLREFRP